jgi:hypothetical protein
MLARVLTGAVVFHDSSMIPQNPRIRNIGATIITNTETPNAINGIRRQKSM